MTAREVIVNRDHVRRKGLRLQQEKGVNNETMSPWTLKVIRLALTGGVLLFGAVVWFLTNRGTGPQLPADYAGPLTLAFAGLALASLVGLAVVRSVQARAADPLRKNTLAVVGWAFGEAPALLGGVFYLMTASPILYLTGVAVLLVAFVMVPIPEQA